MIYDRFENMGLYFGEAESLRKALEFAVNFDRSQPDGRYDIDGDNIYALVMTYETKAIEDMKFEAHKRYIDVQLLLDGSEYMDVSFEKTLEVDTPYSEQNDVALFQQPELFSSVLLKPGNFAVLYPDDIHQPGRSIGDKREVRKMVVKVKL